MIILDASFIVKLFVEEQGSDLAEACLSKLLELGEEISTVDIALAETLNALWKHCTMIRDLEEGDFREAVSDLLNFWLKLEVISTQDLALDAAQLALENRITVYDALYIVATIRQKAGLATFDKRLREEAERHMIPVYP